MAQMGRGEKKKKKKKKNNNNNNNQGTDSSSRPFSPVVQREETTMSEA
jgi:hypothetical protein